MKICYKRQTLGGFKVHGLDLKPMFKELGLRDTQVLRCLVQPDTHVPEHDDRALSAFNKFANDYSPHLYINLGDFIENEPSSHWPANSTRVRRLVPELKLANNIIKETLDACGRQCKFRVFIRGNHEDWTDQLLTSKIPEVYDEIEDLGVDLRIESLLGLKKLGFRVVPMNEILRVGYAHFIHGYYTGQNHAKKHSDVFGVNTYYGHLHDVQCHSKVSVSGFMEAMSLGCLRKLDAAFMKGKPTNWAHAFGIFEFRINGCYTRMAPVIVNGEFSFNGKLYRGSK